MSSEQLKMSILNYMYHKTGKLIPKDTVIRPTEEFLVPYLTFLYQRDEEDFNDIVKNHLPTFAKTETILKILPKVIT